MNNAIKILTVVLIVFCSGCGTTKETLFINSEPTGARVTLSNGMAGATPCTFLVPLKGETVVTIEKVGYESAQVTVAKKVQKQNNKCCCLFFFFLTMVIMQLWVAEVADA